MLRRYDGNDDIFLKYIIYSFSLIFLKNWKMPPMLNAIFFYGRSRKMRIYVLG